MPARKKSSKKARTKTKKKNTSSKNLWIGQGHLYQPADASIRKDLQEN